MLEPEKTVLGEKKRSKLKKGAKFDVEFLEIATRLVAAGMKESELAYFLSCTPRQIKGLKRRDPLFKKACNDGKGLALSYLIAQALRTAAGYDYVESNTKIKRKLVTRKDDDGVVTEEIIEYPAEISEFKKHQPANPQLLMFLVANMSRQLKKDDTENWVSQHKIEIDENKNVLIKISGKIASEQISHLAGAFLDHSKIIDSKVTDTKKLETDDERKKA